jgi:hypothetical protein
MGKVNKQRRKRMTTTAKQLATVNEIIDSAMATRKGVNVNLVWERKCKTKKACQDEITKRTETVGRVGIDYNNQKAVQEAREAGELPSEEQPIWYGKGEWLIFPYLVRHTVTNQLYLRLYSGTDKRHTASVQYFRNGNPVSFENVENDLLASEKSKKNGLCFCVKLEDMIAIGKMSEVEDTAEVPF